VLERAELRVLQAVQRAEPRVLQVVERTEPRVLQVVDKCGNHADPSTSLQYQPCIRILSQESINLSQS